MSAVNDREARLIPTLLNVLVAGMCDPQRLSRGRMYARQGAVMDIVVEAGSLTGFVQGSRRTPYEVTVQVSPARPGTTLTELVPKARDVLFHCSCPDWDDPCKHAVAVMSAFAERVGADPLLLATWRDVVDPVSNERATVGSRARRGEVAAPAPPTISDADREALRVFLGEAVRFEPVPLTTLRRPHSDQWDDPWAAMLDSALDELGASRPG